MKTGFLRGIDGVVADVDIETKGTAFTVTGMADAAIREMRVRVQASLDAMGANAPLRVVEVRPVHIKKDGTGFDLPIALSLLGHFEGAAVGELGLAGDIRPVRGVLPIVEALQRSGVKLVVVAPENGPEAELVDGIAVFKCRTLKEAHKLLTGMEVESDRLPVEIGNLDMCDVKGVDDVKREIEAVAVTGENVLLIGGPGAGKTMLARRLVGILPGMTEVEALETTRCHSVAGLNVGGGMVTQRPFRAPHHSTTPPGLVGGGAALPRPGEMTLAHNGVLFLDEVESFARPAIEVMREVATSGEVVLSRANGTLRFPAKCQIVASANPCPCGRHGDGTNRCRCDADTLKRHNARIDEVCKHLNITKRIAMPHVDLAHLDVPSEDSATIRARVEAARAKGGAQ